jgi:type I restriction enzyme R subunit
MALQYYRLERIFSGAIPVKDGEVQYVKSPTEVGTRKAKDEQAPLPEIIEVLNERFGTQFAEEDRLFFQQIKDGRAGTTGWCRRPWPTLSTSSR